MANNPTDPDRDPVPPRDPAARPRPAGAPEPELPDPGEIDLSEFADAAPAESVSDATRGAIPVADPLDEPISDAVPVLDLPPDDISEAVPVLTPPPDSAAGDPRPVAPASGWLDEDGPPAQLRVEEADLFEAPPTGVAASDVFAAAPPPAAPEPDQSDVIVTAAGADDPAARAEDPARTSEVALTFDHPPGSTARVDGGSGDLPLAEEIPDAADDGGSLFDEPVPVSALPFEPVPTPGPVSDAPDYGATPEYTHDASSILADLAGPPPADPDGSAVPIEAPSDRTRRDPAGTEFDLTPVDDVPVPPELAGDGDSDLFANTRTAPDLDLYDSGLVVPAEPDPTDEQPSLASTPSSIFTGRPPTSGSARAPARPADEDDSSVEFSDHPSAEDEAAASRIFGPPSPGRPAARRPDPAPAAGGEDDPIAGLVNWGGEDDVLGADPTTAQDSPPSGILSRRGRGPRPGEPAPAGKTDPARAGRPGPAARDDDPSVEIDWLSGSSTEKPLVVGESPAGRDPGTAGRGRTRPSPAGAGERPARAGRAGAWVGGALIGAVVAGGACAGAYFGGLVPNAGKTAQAPPPPPPGPLPPGGVGPSPPPAEMAVAEVFALVQGRGDAPPAAAALEAARKRLQDAADPGAAKTPEEERQAVRAAVHVGVTHELAGDRDAARKAYADAKAKFPEKYGPVFDAALDRLAATAPPAAPPAPDGEARRPAPADAGRLLLAVTLLQPPKADAPADDTEAGVYFWKAVKLAAAEKYADAVAEIGNAKAAHLKQAKALAGRGLNPLSDPLEQIFPRTCDDLKAYWELRAAIYANRPVADLLKKDGAEKGLADLAAAAAKVPGLTADLKAATDNLKDRTDKLATATKELKVASDLAADLKVEVKKTDEAKVAAEKKLEAEEKARKAADELVAAVARELQGAKLLPEKFGPAELVAAQKAAAERAAGPTLTALVPPGMMAVGGAPLTAGQLADVADRLGKAEAANKTAADRLAAEVKRLAAEHAGAMKKLTEAHAAAVDKLKDDRVADLKAAGEKYAAEAKKLTDGYEAKVKALDAAVAREQERVKAQAAEFSTGGGLTRSQALDLWLPILVELRRPADADGALAAARKVIAAPVDPGDAGKGHTVAGLALLLKGDPVGAKAEFQAARADPAHGPAAKAKAPWAAAADVGLASVDDPLAPYRRPAESPRRDPAAAARLLDAGVTAYKAGRYADAVTALTAAAQSDPTDPLTWYFLGASRWALGSTDQARRDFLQGAEREGLSSVPTRVVSAALAPIQGPARDALTAARP